MNEKTFQNYVYDLGIILKEKAINAKKIESKSIETTEHAYDLGFLMAMHEVISIMQQQAISFEIDFKHIGLNGVNPEKDLL